MGRSHEYHQLVWHKAAMGGRVQRLAGDWSATDTCMSTKLSLACSKPINSPANGSNRTGFATASGAQRPNATTSWVPAHASNGRTIPCQALVRRGRISSGVSTGGRMMLAWRCPVLAQRAVAGSPRWTRARWEPAIPPLTIKAGRGGANRAPSFLPAFQIG